MIYRTRLQPPKTLLEEDDLPVIADEDIPSYADSSIAMAINPDYAATGFRTFLLGNHHRDLWTEPVTAPYLDMGTAAGGLTPVKRGGGMQTVSLRLEGADGKEYVLRSLDKDPSGTVPAILKGTIATDIVQDQITSINPYGAFIIPKLAKAAGVFYTEPSLVYVPDDPRLGPFRSTFANQLLMFEDRPDDDQSDKSNYGNTEEVISGAKMYEKITEDNDDRVDQLAFARVRLFDMLLSDWDRHRGQWRWATFDDPDGRGDIFKPIPRDRDWAFNRMDGLPTLASQFDPKFQDFSESFGYLKGLTINGHEQDRRLLNGVTREQWLEIASELQDALKGDVIERAVNDWPESIQRLEAEETVATFRTRLSKLHEVAEEYYEILAGVVDWVGSDKHERVELVVSRTGDIAMTAYKTSKVGEIRQKIYERTFLSDETKELRLFGLDGNDSFYVRGGATRINVIVVGGPGDDLIENTSRIVPRYFDTQAYTNSFDGVRALIDTDPAVNNYDPLDFKHDARLPQLFFGHNSDDGVFIGGGLKFINNGFRKAPFAVSRTIIGNVATRTGAFNIQFESVRTDVSGPWDASFKAYVSSPATIRNFFGFGNETDRITDRKFYEHRLTQVGLMPSLRADIEGGLTASLGPTLTVTRVDEDTERYLATDTDVGDDVYETQYLAGLHAELGVRDVQGGSLPSKGFHWINTFSAQSGVSDSKDRFIKMSTDMRIYVSPVPGWLTIAMRAGSDHIVGDFPFYQSSSLGGATNLRGFLRDRFNGRTSFYQNVEARLRLTSFSSYVATGQFGVLGFLDNGRVWFDGKGSSLWHQGYGGGVWTNLLGVLTLSSWVAASDNYTTFSLQFGFQY